MRIFVFMAITSPPINCAVAMSRLEVHGEAKNRYEQEALVEPSAPYYALYSYKVMSSDRFDLLGNSLAILTGIASPQWAQNLIAWIEAECEAMRGRGELAVNLPPCLFPYILPHHADWLPRYERYNRPGDYHNGACGHLSAVSMWRHA
jgi:hypothetical protein